MAQIDENYFQFCMYLNKNNVKWCFIKDFDFLLKNKYDNEIDIICYKKDRNKIRKLSRKLKWAESTHNKFNTHLIFWKFVNGIPYRIDIHLGKALATAAPFFKAEEILQRRIKVGNLYNCSKKFELGIIILCALRGRKEIKDYRVKKAIELMKYKNETKKLFNNKHIRKNLENFYYKVINKEIFYLSTEKRLGYFEIIKLKFLQTLLFLNRLLNPSPCYYFELNKNKKKELDEKLRESKIKYIFVKIDSQKKQKIIKLFLNRIFYDLVIFYNDKNNIEIDNYSISEILDTIYKKYKE